MPTGSSNFLPRCGMLFLLTQIFRPPLLKWLQKSRRLIQSAFEFGDALWVKVFTTEFEDPIGLEELVADNAHVQQAETETEWQLLQKDFNNPLSGQLESGYGAPVGPNAASILRRYEFYEFSGVYDPETHEAQFDPGFGDSHPGPNDVGTYLGSQNAAVNLD